MDTSIGAMARFTMYTLHRSEIVVGPIMEHRFSRHTGLLYSVVVDLRALGYGYVVVPIADLLEV